MPVSICSIEKLLWKYLGNNDLRLFVQQWGSRWTDVILYYTMTLSKLWLSLLHSQEKNTSRIKQQQYHWGFKFITCIDKIIWRVLHVREWRFGDIKKFTKMHKIIYYKVRIQMKFWIARTWLYRKSRICLLIWEPRNWYCGGQFTNSLMRGFHLPH